MVGDPREDAAPSPSGLLRREEPAPSSRRGFPPPTVDPTLSLSYPTAGRVREAAERFEYEIFRASGFCRPSRHERVEEYDEWAGQSRFAVVVDSGGGVVGATRILVGRYCDLPAGRLRGSTNDIGEPVLEVASIAIRPDHRSVGIADRLYRAALADSYRCRVKAIVMVVDPWLEDILEDYYGVAPDCLGPRTRYMGGDVRPVAYRIPEHVNAFARARPALWQFILDEFTPGEVADFDLPIVLP
ncbi:MAG: hypothetical protein JJLCMIEE_02782 [Acidimicrobiales bacterium]|nr:hypothetical protein [Acidimicrobiales bacterium]